MPRLAFRWLRYVAPLVACACVAGASGSSADPGPTPDRHYENFAADAPGALSQEYGTVSLAGGPAPTFSVVAGAGGTVLAQQSPRPYDALYYATAARMHSLEESYSFTYRGPQSVVEPCLMLAPDAENAVRAFVTNITASAPGNNNAGDESYLTLAPGATNRRVAIRGRLRTEPYFYTPGHVYRVDVIADPQSHVLSTRVYDTALGPQTFDRTIQAVSPTFAAYPGLINVGGGRIAVRDFAFGRAGELPQMPHVARRAGDYMNYLGYNASVNGNGTSIVSQAFIRYFPALSIRHVRVAADGGSFAPTLNAVAQDGIDADVLTSRTTTIASLQRFIASLRLPPDSIELWNEPNNQSMGASYDAAYLQRLPPFARDVARAFPGATIWGPSILPDRDNFPSVESKLAASLGPLITGWNTHSYAESTPENTGYGGFFSNACGASQHEDCGWYGSPTWNDNESATIAPAAAGVSTEGGASYGTSLAHCGTALVDLATQQAYVQRGMLYDFKLGHARIYPYKFIDDGGCSYGFGTYGIMALFRNPDHSIRAVAPKPAYTALVSLDHVLADSGATARSFTPAPLQYALHGAAADAEESLLAESDGSYRLVLWSDAPLWDFNANGPRKTGAPVPAVTTPVSLHLEKPARLRIFSQTPGTGAWSGTAARPPALNIDAAIGPYPIVIDIQPARGGRTVELPHDVATPGPTEAGDP